MVNSIQNPSKYSDEKKLLVNKSNEDLFYKQIKRMTLKDSLSVQFSDAWVKA